MLTSLALYLPKISGSMSSHGVKNKHQIAATILKKNLMLFQVQSLWIKGSQTALIFFFFSVLVSALSHWALWNDTQITKQLPSIVVIVVNFKRNYNDSQILPVTVSTIPISIQHWLSCMSTQMNAAPALCPPFPQYLKGMGDLQRTLKPYFYSL